MCENKSIILSFSSWGFNTFKFYSSEKGEIIAKKERYQSYKYEKIHQGNLPDHDRPTDKSILGLGLGLGSDTGWSKETVTNEYVIKAL